MVVAAGNAFGQTYGLALVPSDIRLEPVYTNGAITGCNLFVRKKPGMDSVMLTESTGYHALRSLEWNPINGSERRELSGVPLIGAYSLYSIVSSTPIPDIVFGSCFQLFIPLRVVYGNPSSSAGTVYLNISNGVKINIRTFDHKYADPGIGRFQNNLLLIHTPAEHYSSPYAEVEAASAEAEAARVEAEIARAEAEAARAEAVRAYSAAEAQPSSYNSSNLKMVLRDVVLNREFLDQMQDEELRRFLRNAFLEKQREQRQEK